MSGMWCGVRVLAAALMSVAWIRAPLAAQTVQGQAMDAATRRPIAGVIRLLDTSAAEAARTTLTADGRYTLAAPEPGRYRIRLESPGYQIAVSSAVDLTPGLTLVMNVEVRALTPAMLDTIVVAGAVIPFRLLDFYDRRTRGGGAFITRQEFEPYGPTRMTDVLRRMPGISVRPNPDYGRPDPVTGLRDTRQYLINSNRIPEIQANVCASVVFLDGAYVGNTRTVDLDNYLNMDFVDAIEAYSGAGNVPAEFNRQGAECGVIAAWSRTSVDVGPALSAHLDLGGQLGGRVSGEGLEDGRLGMQAVVSFAGLFEFYPAVNLLVGWSVGSASAQRTGWQFLAGLRTRPLGRGSPWYLGAGYTVLDFRETGNPLTDPELEEGRAVLLTGTTFAAGWLRPFVELQVLDPFQRAGRQVHAFTGLTFRAY